MKRYALCLALILSGGAAFAASPESCDWPQWQGPDRNEKGDQGVAKGSVTLADGRLYYRTEDGTMLLIEPSSKQYIERGRFNPPDRSKQPAWAHPVIANGKLYLRDQDVLLSYNVKAK